MSRVRVNGPEHDAKHCGAGTIWNETKTHTAAQYQITDALLDAL